jgi:hypothetical protein
MVTARIRTNASRITVRVRNAPARTVVARPGRRPVVVPAGAVEAPVAVRRKPTLKERLLRPFRSAK